MSLPVPLLLYKTVGVNTSMLSVSALVPSGFYTVLERRVQMNVRVGGGVDRLSVFVPLVFVRVADIEVSLGELKMDVERGTN